MPQYEVEVPGYGKYRVESPTELTDAQAYAAIQDQIANQPKPQSGLLPAIKSGIASLKGDTAATLGRMGAIDVGTAEKYRAEQEAYRQRTFKPTEEGWADAPFTKMAELAGGSLPYMVAPLVAGGAAAALGAPALVGLGAAGLASAGQFVGSGLSRQVEEGTPLAGTNIQAATLAAIPSAALDVVGFKMIPGIRRLFGAAGTELTPQAAAAIAKQGVAKVAADYALATGTAMTVEGLTEAGQQVFERLQAGLNIADPAARAEYLESFIGGAVLGGAIAPAGRYIERGMEADAQTRAAAINKQREAYERVVAARQAEEARTAQLQDPAYLDDLLVRSQEVNAKLQQLRDATKGSPKEDAALAPLELAEKQNARRARAEFEKSDELRAFRAEMGRAAPFIRQRQEELKAQKAAAAEQQKKDDEVARVATLTPEQYALEQLQQGGAQWTSRQTGGRGKGALGATSEEELAAIRAEREQALQAPLLAQQKPLQEYASRQLEHPRSLGITDTSTFVSYLMENPAQARKLVQTQTPLPDLTPQQSRQVLAALNSALALQDRQQQKADKAEVTTEYAQRTRDLQGQLPQAPTATEKRTQQTVESWQQSMADEEEVRKTGESNLDYLLPALERAASGSPAGAVAPATPIAQTRTADEELSAIDALYAKLEQANKDEQTAKRANESGAVEAARSRRQAAADALNKLTEGSAYTREVVRQRFEQQTALDEMQNHAERLRQGQYLGYNFGTGETKAKGLVADIQQQIAAREADKVATDNPGEMQRIDAELTRLKVQLNAAQTAATRASDRGQSDLASTTKPLLWKKAEAARDAYIKSTLEEAAAHRAARNIQPLTYDEALKAASELHDLLDLRIDRSDGERNRYINKRLAEIKESLNNPPRERTRVAAEPLTPQYAATEAKKTAEAKGETAKTLGGELRRRGEYVGNLIEKALGRDMPADVRSALEAAQQAIDDGRVTRDLLNAAETQAERVLTGRLKGVETTYSRDPKQRGRGVAETDLQEDPRYVQDIRDALAAMEETPEGQRELFAPVDNAESIAQREQEITAIDAEIAEQQALHDRFEKAAVRNRTDIRPAAERMVGIKADIEAKRQQQEIIRKEIARLKQEETDKAAAAKQIEDLGTPIQKGEPQVFETEGGFTPDDQEAAFGKTPPMATSVLAISLFAKSPALRKAKRDAAKLRGLTEYAAARENIYSQMMKMRSAIVADLQTDLDAALAQLESHKWLETAHPQMRRKLGGHDIELALGPIYEKDIRDATAARLGTERIKKKAADLRAQIAQENKRVNDVLAQLAVGDPAVVQAKKKAERVNTAQRALDEQRGALQQTMDRARNAALERIRNERENIFGSSIAQLEGQISGLTVQLENARSVLTDRLSAQGPFAILGAAAKAGSYSAYVDKLVAEETKDVRKALAAAEKQLEALYQQSEISNVEVNVAAAGDKLVKFEYTRLDKMQKALDKLLDDKAPGAEVAAATEELARQRGIAEQARQAANAASDAVYKAKNERLTQESTLTRDARVAPLQRQLDALEAQAKKITGKRGFAKLSPVEQAKALAEVNAKIAAVQAQRRKLTGETLASAYEKGGRNASVAARIARLEDMIASPRSSARRVTRARMALDLLQRRTQQMGRVVGPVARDASPVSGTFNVGDTAAQTAAKTSAAPTTGPRKKYLDQKRAPAKSTKSDALVAAELRLQSATETWNNATALAETEGLSRADRKAAEAAALEAQDAMDAAQAALEAEQARGVVAPTRKPAVAKQGKQSVKGTWDEDFELASAAEKTRTVLDETASAHVRDGNLQSALEYLAKNASTETYRALAAKLAPFVTGTKIGVQRGLKHKGEVAAGMYYGAQNRIAINPLFMTEEDVLHEVLHAATMQVLYNKRGNLTPAQAAAVKQLENMFASIKNNPQFKGEYGATNLDEFITEMYTDPALRDKLDGIGKPTSLFQRIWNAILRMLDIAPSQKTMKAIDAIMSESGRVDYAKQAASMMYHGSPNNAIKTFKGIVHLTPSKGAAEKFANREVAFTAKTEGASPRVYEIDFDTSNTLDLRKPEHRAAYEKARREHNATVTDPDERLPALTSEGFIQRGSGVPSFGQVSAILDAMPAFDSVFVDDGAIHNGLTVAARADAVNAQNGDGNAKTAAFFDALNKLAPTAGTQPGSRMLGTVSVELEPLEGAPNTVYLRYIEQLGAANKGAADRALQQVLSLADEHQQTLVLQPEAPAGRDSKKNSMRLESWYGRHGFRSGDMGMYRKPTADFNRASKAGRSDFENLIIENRSTGAQLFEARGKLGLAMRQATADMRASLREVLQRGDSFTGMQAQASLLTADSFVGNGMAVAENGAFTFSKDAKGYIKMEAGGSKSLVDVMQAIGEIPIKDISDRMAKFQAYVTALRGEQVGYDMLDFKDPKGAEAKGAALLAEVRANPQMLKALQTAHEVYRDLNRGLVQFLKDTHAISADVANRLLADKNYIPFYRERGGSLEMVMPTGHPHSIGDIRSLPFLQTLKGGDEKLMGFPEAALKNISILTNLGVQNMANRHIAYHLSAIGRTVAPPAKPTMQVRRRDGGTGSNILRWKQEPDPAIPNDTGDRHIVLDTAGTAAEDIPTDLLTKAVAGSFATFPWLLDVAGSFSNLLRMGVTRNPAYLVGQLIKDPFAASMTGNLKASPVRAIAQVIRNFGQIISGTSIEESALRRAGVVHSNVFSGDKNDLNKVALQIAGNQQGFIRRGLAGLDKLAMSADAATRTQAYKDAIAAGASEVEAIVSARELANFARQGAEPSVQFLAKAIPFFNASIQGLDATLRSAQGRMPASQLYNAKQKFFNRALGLAGMTVIYSLMMDEDEEWRRMSLRDKISYIHIPRIFGQQEPLRLPAPFEMGMLFYSMPMAFMEAMKEGFTPADWKVVRSVMLAQLPGSGSIMPQFAKGVYDVTRNYNTGTGQPIVPKSLEGKDPVYQYTARTTEAAKRMAEVLNDSGVKLSPIQLEFLSSAYLGGLPLGIAQMTNQVFAKESKAGVERPAGKSSDMPIFGRFFQSGRGTDDIEHMYEFAAKAKQANDTFNMLKKQGDMEEARDYLLKHRPEIAMAKFAGEFTKVMGTLKQMDDFVNNAPNMSAQAKQERKDKIQEQREQLAKNFKDVLKRAPAPA